MNSGGRLVARFFQKHGFSLPFFRPKNLIDHIGRGGGAPLHDLELESDFFGSGWLVHVEPEPDVGRAVLLQGAELAGKCLGREGP